jgi:hypothetical protein
MENELVSKYGNIIFAKVTGFCKYQFTIYVKTDKGYEVGILTGGDHENIYRYQPFSTSWKHHLDCTDKTLFRIVEATKIERN